jgi:putative hemolysin
MCNMAVNISATLLAVNIMPRWFAMILMTLLILIFGEATPKTLAIKAAPNIVLIVAPFFFVLSIVLNPLVFVFRKVSRGLVNLSSALFYRNVRESTLFHSEEMMDVIKESQISGILNHEEGNILSNLIKFPQYDIYKVSRPRNEIFSIPITTKLEEVFEMVKEKKFSRIPVWENNEENIVGIFHVKDFLQVTGKKRKLTNYRNILRKPFFVPDSVKAAHLLKEFQSTRNHIAIVINEFGGVSGIVTLEDILEEIIGQVIDKDDIKPLYHKYNQEMIEVEARMEITEVNKVFKVNIKSEGSNSIGGYLLEIIRKIPKAGEIFIFGDLKFKITGASASKIDKVLISKIKQEPEK